MVFIEQLARLFGSNPKLLGGTENFTEGKWRFGYNPWSLPTVDILSTELEKFPQRDAVLITVSIDNGTPHPLNSRVKADVNVFLGELETYYRMDSGRNNFELNIQVSKKLVNDEISVFCLDHFEETLVKLNSKQLFAAFAMVCSSDIGSRCNLVKQEIIEFSTDSLIFSNSPQASFQLGRDALITARKGVSHFDGSRHAILPEDFHLQKHTTREKLNSLFDRLCLVSLLSFLADVSSLSEEGKFYFKINGYRAITGEIDRQQVSKVLVEELFKVYRWAFSGGCTSDKIGLARNIVSLHWKGDVAVNPDEGIYESILSGYTVYLKENVDRYVSLKKSLCDYLSEFSQKSAALAESIGDKLEKNFVAFVGFFISTILLKIVTEKDLGGIFPKPLQIIAWSLVGASLVHGITSFVFSLSERRRVLEDFGLLRLRYSDLLHKSDLDRALGGDEGLRKATAHLDLKLKLYFGAWLAMLIICCVTIICLGQSMPTEQPAESKKAVDSSKVNSVVSAPKLEGAKLTNFVIQPLSPDKVLHPVVSTNPMMRSPGIYRDTNQ